MPPPEPPEGTASSQGDGLVNPVVGVVVVVFEQSDGEVHRFADALGLLTYGHLRVYLVNNSPGRDLAGIGVWPSHCPVTVVEAGANRGFTGGANAGIAAARADQCGLVLLLNTDVKLSCPGLIQRLLGPFSIDPACGMVSPVITQAPKGDLIWYQGAEVGGWSGIPRHPGLGRPYRSDPHPEPRPTQVCNGCCVLISGRLLDELGGFDEDYFAYFDEVDLSLRARSAGYHLYLWPEALLSHEKSGHTFTPVESYYMTRNSLIFVRKQISPIRRPVAVLAQIAVAFPAYFLRSRSRSAKAAWMRGVRDGFRALFAGLPTATHPTVTTYRIDGHRPGARGSDVR